MTVVASALKDKKQLESVGGESGIAQFLERVMSTANVDQYALLIREKWTRRQLFELGDQVSNMAYSDRKSPELITSIRESLDQLTGVEADDWVSLGDLQAELYGECQRLLDGGERDVVPSGYIDIDSMLSGGFEPGTINVIGGRPSMGKSAFALALAAEMARSAPVGFYSMEMSSKALARRLAASASGIWGSAIKTMKLSNPQMVDQILQSILSMGDGRDLFMRFKQPNIDELCNDVRSAISRHGLKVVFIDHLHLIDGNTDTAALAKISNQLANLCRSTGVVLFELCQLSRAVEGRNNKRPKLDDLKQSGALEQDADNVLLLYRDEYYNPDSQDRGIMEAIFAKQRDGPLGTVKLLFEPEFSRIRNLAT
jgi:replicative DNA helicase